MLNSGKKIHALRDKKKKKNSNIFYKNLQIGVNWVTTCISLIKESNICRKIHCLIHQTLFLFFKFPWWSQINKMCLFA